LVCRFRLSLSLSSSLDDLEQSRPNRSLPSCFIPSLFSPRRIRPATLTSLLTLLLLPTDLKSGSKVAASIEVSDDISALDFDDAAGNGFQSSFARLGASEAIKEDPVSYVGGDEKAYLKAELAKVAGGAVGPLLGQVDPAALARLQG
jgi:hypothetical protein